MKIQWHLNREPGLSFDPGSRLSELYEPIGFPEPWPDRPWIYGVMVESLNGVVAWKPEQGEIHPVAAILGGDFTRPEALADKLHVLHLYTFGDIGIGAQTVRDQQELVLDIREPGKEIGGLEWVYGALEGLRVARGLSPHPRSIVYSPSGNLSLEHPIFASLERKPTIITTAAGAGRLRVAGALERGITVVAPWVELDSPALLAAHQKLFAEYGTRYLDCMGGETLLQALHDAGILDEIFVTSTDVEIDEAAHEGVKRTFDFEREGAELIAEGKVSPESRWVFRRWRFNRR